MTESFIHLHTHSEYSLSDGILRLDQLIEFAKSQNMSSLALTDRDNFYAAIKFYQKARKKGIKPILGVDLSIVEPDGKRFRMVLLAQNRQGFVRLCELVSYAYEFDRDSDGIAVRFERLSLSQCEGIIALSGANDGDIFQLCQQDSQAALARAQHWQRIFPNRYYFQLARIGKAGEAQYFEFCAKAGKQLHISAVATNLACFLTADDFQVHEVRTCISAGYVIDDAKRPRQFTQEQYLKTPAQMRMAFVDAPQLLVNTETVAARCNVELDLGNNYLPDFPVPAGETVASFLQQEAQRGLEERLVQLFPDVQLRQEKVPIYQTRLQTEVGVINEMGFAGYFLIVADFIRWAKENAIPVGPGRGSGAGSLVAYALSITDLDPLAYDLLFERFLNPERVSMPDFDVDFCMDKRDQVIAYVAEKYGHEKVSQIATHGTMAAKAVVRDVGRVLGMPYGFCDNLSKMIPAKPLGTSLSDALGRSQKAKEEPVRVSQSLIESYETNENTRSLIDTALRLEGLARNVGKHAGGVVIAPSKLTDFSALYAESAGAPLSVQFDKDDIEAAGLVKFDFLGLRTLTVIDWALALVNRKRAQAGQAALNLSLLPLDDAKTFELLQSGNTTAVFQLESAGMKELIKKLRPDNFEDIVALVALYRPGPLQSGMVDDFIARKHGLAEVYYPHPALENVLNTTYGVMVYQEQVMQVAQILANYSLGEADLLRRAMGKKKKEVMDQQREIFVERAVSGGVASKQAVEIFDLMAKFAEYGFNKSHSAAYALLSYQTAWLKAHYPAEFMAAVLTSEMDDTDKIVKYIDECWAMGLEIAPPCINRSQYAFSVEAGKIIYGLGAVKGVGEAAIGRLLTERAEQGAFVSFSDLCARMDLKKLNRKTLETLICAGAFDEIHANRGALMAALPTAIQLAEQHHKNQSLQQSDMFGLFAEDAHQDRALHFDESQSWSARKVLEHEKKVLGLFLSDHPINAVKQTLNQICSLNLGELSEEMSQWEVPKRKEEKIEKLVGGLISELRIINNKKSGEPMAFVSLDDRSARIEFGVFGEVLTRHQLVLQPDNVIIAKLSARYYHYRNEWRLSAEQIWTLEQAQIDFLRGLSIDMDLDTITDAQWQALTALKPAQNGVRLRISARLSQADLQGKFILPNAYHITEQDLIALSQHFGKTCVQYDY